MHATILALTLIGPAAAPPAGDAEVLRLIERLGDDSQEARDAAEKGLRAMGRSAMWRLMACRRHPDLEVRMRTGRVARAIDPALWKRDEMETRRQELLVRILAMKDGHDAARWGEDVPNPFTHLTPSGRKELEAEGVDVNGLLKMRAVMIEHCPWSVLGLKLVSRDPRTIIVLGHGFSTRSPIFAAGPVLAVGNARVDGPLAAAGPVWFAETALGTADVDASPFLSAPDPSALRVRFDNSPRNLPVIGEFGWRRPPGWLATPKWGGGAKLPPLRADDAEKKRAALRKTVLAAGGDDTAEACKPTANPLAALSEAGKARLRMRGVDPDRLAKLKAVLLTGEYRGKAARDFVNRDPDTVLILADGFVSAGRVSSAGPLVALGHARFQGPVTGADIVWLAEKTMALAPVRGLPVIAAPSAHLAPEAGYWPDIWVGHYGWTTVTSKAP